jgi:hypothetical protein
VFPDTAELFAGTTKCFELARSYLDGFKVPFEVVGGNHDLEGIDEFPTDELNMEAYLRILKKPTPHFLREVAPKVLLVGLGSVLFRDAPYTSHEVVIDDEQIKWFENLAVTHPADEGWKIFVFSHAPPMVKSFFNLAYCRSSSSTSSMLSTTNRAAVFAYCKRTTWSMAAAG